MNTAGAPRSNAFIPVDTEKIVGGSKLLGEMRDLIRRRHYSIRTEQAYLEWVKRYILFHGKRHPNEMDEPQIVAFLNHLAVKREVAASTQNQALNALVFLYKQVLEREELALENITRAKRPERLPTVFERDEVERLFVHIEGVPKLVAALLYGTGLRLLQQTLNPYDQRLSDQHLALVGPFKRLGHRFVEIVDKRENLVFQRIL